MRILSLDLERYGPFTDQRLAFRPDAKLHIIYGQNEAGKSCALAAITDLLFAIEARTRYDFLHEGKNLRIGATIEGRDGSRLTFQRRKGNKNTLLDGAGKPLGDDALLPYLGGISREVFCHAFGLDTERLRAGAEEMLTSGGEVGASLFAAASGLRGLTELRRSLEVEADGIFAPRAAKDRVFYQALDRFETARKAIREQELRAGDWKAINESIEALGARLEEIKSARRRNAAEHARLARLKRIAPLLRQLDLDLGQLGSLGELPGVPEGFTELLRGAIGANADATNAWESAGVAHKRAKLDLAEIAVDEPLIATSGEVQRLFAETGAYANDRRDLPRIQSEELAHSALLGQLATRLGLADPKLVAERQPADSSLALVRHLIAEGKKLDQAWLGHKQALESELETLASLERQRIERGTVIDPRPLREKFAAVAPVLKQLDKLHDVQRAETAETRSIAQAASCLNPAIADLDSFSKAPKPDTETIAGVGRSLNQIAESILRASERATKAAETRATIEIRIRDLASGGPVPSSDVIAAERHERNKAWVRLRGSLVGNEEPLAIGPLTETIARFERHSAEADRLADSAASDAERVAAYAAESRSLEQSLREEGEARGKVAALELERGEVLEAWRADWMPAGLAPLPPAEMAVWLSKVNGLFERRAKCDTLREEIDLIGNAVRAVVPALESIAGEISLPQLPGLDPGLLANRIETRLNELDKSWGDARDLETSVRDSRARMEKLVLAESGASSRLDAWRARWCESVGAIGLSPNSTLEEADAALLAWTEVPGTIRERDNRARRVSGMRRNVDRFEAETAALCGAVAPDLVSLPAGLAIKELTVRLTAARGSEARRDQARKQLASTTHSLADAETALKEAQAGLSTLAAHLPEGSDVVDVLNRLGRRDTLLASLAERRNQIVVQGDGFSEDQLRAELAAFDVDQADASLMELAAEGEALERKAQEAFADRDREERNREALEQGVGAEVALQKRRNAEAELLDAAREWAILRLGALLIERVIERHRASQQDPLMTRAGTLFSILTGGTFVSLGQEFDEVDTPRLVGRRASGELVSIQGLSEGTRDQLYLALRLAYLEDYSARAEAVPFIGDDLFTSFDEERTANGIATLAAIGDCVQPILFTHHRHVVEIGRKVMGPELAVVELGG